MWNKIVVSFATVFTLVIGALSSFADTQAPRIDFPKNYRAEMVNYLSLDRTQNPDQIIRLFAPKAAMEAAKAGQELPDGTVLVAEVYKAKLDADGDAVESSLGSTHSQQICRCCRDAKTEGMG